MARPLRPGAGGRPDPLGVGARYPARVDGSGAETFMRGSPRKSTPDVGFADRACVDVWASRLEGARTGSDPRGGRAEPSEIGRTPEPAGVHRLCYPRPPDA